MEGNPVSYLDPFGLAIAVLQELVSLASVFVSGLSLLALVSPQVAIIVNVVLIIIEWTLDVIQIYRYDAAPDKGMKLCQDIVSSILGLLSPYDELQSLYEIFKYVFQNRNGWNLDE